MVFQTVGLEVEVELELELVLELEFELELELELEIELELELELELEPNNRTTLTRYRRGQYGKHGKRREGPHHHATMTTALSTFVLCKEGWFESTPPRRWLKKWHVIVYFEPIDDFQSCKCLGHCRLWCW
jgi:hypothetical protein